MIDIHSHILPGLDDGPKDLTESLGLLKIAQADGITHMVATPHIHLGRFNNAASHIYDDLAVLKAKALVNNIGIKLAVAAEVRLDVELMTLVMSKKLPFIGNVNGANYVLLELPHSHVSQGYDKFITWLDKKNIKTIIPHPERNRDIQAKPFYIERLKQLGCEFQLTASSIEGEWGEQAKAISVDMLKSGLVSYVASDAHSVKRRPPILSKARQIVSDLMGADKAHELFVTNPFNLTASLFDE
ncbi:capsule biosynthesis protein CapC [Pseudoalteromonas distincta]|uniref:protein-tyrosine-phosphatase n=1 Tax=Pseudoalteromonas distincta TaxID=77608 RepID=A0ABT9GB55_9GAMM|nr:MULTISPECIES: CpsB/CapC family capsule biosynthesis tyrosine phosphatase [Pseudoalteromonas distincta group]KHM46525.1 capsule biosynthesis protein CapC [Pseudoalteromonas elyakovii]KID34132.1 capsule biosynthesis protein CapC [Pseudoalteromonas distincta]MDP4483110.1 capsule biosynthesis protein CapC [Pseudoalteromonas elyakovii]